MRESYEIIEVVSAISANVYLIAHRILMFKIEFETEKLCSLTSFALLTLANYLTLLNLKLSIQSDML